MTSDQRASAPARAALRSPFTRDEALAAGVPARTLRTKRVRPVFRGVYTWTDDAEMPLIRTRAALTLHPSTAFASHHSALRVQGLPEVVNCRDEHISVFDPSARRPRDGIRTHLAAPNAPVVVREGIRVSHVIGAFLELATDLSIVDLVVLGDAIVNHGMATPDELVRAADDHRRPGCVPARRAARFVRVGVDSPMETRLRLLVVLAGLPEPVVNFTIRDRDGRARRRFDLCYPDAKLIVEYDGRQHAENTVQWQHDLVRREELDGLGWRLIIVTAEGIYRTPAQTLHRVHHALRERGGAACPRHLADDWRLHFLSAELRASPRRSRGTDRHAQGSRAPTARSAVANPAHEEL